MKNYHICLLPGDGIGPEIMPVAVRVLDAVGERFGFSCTYDEQLIGGCAIDATGTALPDATVAACKASDAVLLAAVGGPKWDTTDPDAPRPEQGLLGIRAALETFCNLRPIMVFDSLVDSSPLKPELVRGADLVIVRELIGGIYFGPRKRRERIAGAGGTDIRGNKIPGRQAFDTMFYRECEIERVVRRAFDLARSRRGHLCSVDKANVLETSRLWREIAHQVARAYPDVDFTDMLVDNAAMQIIRDPHQFDVIVTENLFGDILSDEAAMIPGSLGMLASASLGRGTALYEPTHGSAPDIAGKGIANPFAQLLSVELMLRLSFDRREAADCLHKAIEDTLAEGYRTRDIAQPGCDPYLIHGTEHIGDLVVSHIENS